MSEGSLTFVGLGLYDEKDVSLKAVDEIKKCDQVFAEFYTAKLSGTQIDRIENIIGKKIRVLSREETEKGDLILDSAKKEKIVFLTAGDPMTATTHIDLRVRAVKNNIKTKVIHGVSIISAVPGLLGLQNYKFGRTTTLAYPEKDYFPTSPYKIIGKNKNIGLHTLVLLDIQADKNRFMTANEGLELLQKMEKKERGEIFKDSILCVVARAGSDNSVIKAGSLEELIDFDFGPPLHSIVVAGDLHFMEVEALKVLAQLPA